MLCAAVVVSALAVTSVNYDLVVYGSSPAGIAAAVAAGTLGLRVALFEPLKMIGGMGAAGNLALNDGGMPAERTGLAREFSLRNGRAYGLETEVPHPESFVAEASFHAMLADANVTAVKLDCRLLSAASASVDGVSRVASVSVLCEPMPVTATVFIDASYDGEVMIDATHMPMQATHMRMQAITAHKHASGAHMQVMVAVGDVDYTAGREAIATYNESLAGARVPGWNGVSGPRHVNALTADGKLLKYVANLSTLAPPGAADDALMAFQHRMCISGDADRVPWPQPNGYNRTDFELLQRALDAGGGDAGFFTRMPPATLPGYPGAKKKYCLCCGISIGATDQPMLNRGWASASWERRQAIIADHTYFELGSFFYLANDPSVPASVRATFASYGLCADEFSAFGHVPPQLYIRISNRLVGDYVITQVFCKRARTQYTVYSLTHAVTRSINRLTK